jgi:hypothetical protein
MTPAEKCKKRQKKENYQSMEQELFSSSSSTSNNNSATDKMQQQTYARSERQGCAGKEEESARMCELPALPARLHHTPALFPRPPTPFHVRHAHQ